MVNRRRSACKSIIALVCAACFLTASLGSVSRAAAADDWETWPKKSSRPDLYLKPPVNEGEAAGAWKKPEEVPADPDKDRKPAAGRSYGTIGWIALGVAAVIGIAIAAGGSGGGGRGQRGDKPGASMRTSVPPVGSLRRRMTRQRLLLALCVLIPLVFSSCGGEKAAQRKAYIEGLNSEIGFATIDDLIPNLGPPQQTTETPEGTWHTWRKVNAGAVSGGVSIGFFGIGAGAPAETGEELNCLFDRNTGKLASCNHRKW